MENSNVLRVMRAFFGKHFSKDSQMRFMFWFLLSQDADAKDAAEREIWDECDSSITSETIEDLAEINDRIASEQERDEESKKRETKNWIIWGIAASILLIIGTALSVRLYDTTALAPDSPNILECYVPYGETRELTLPDKSHVYLNSGSLLLFPEKFVTKERKIYLTGEARIIVAKNQRKPFIVCSDNMNVKALGTRFNLSAYPHSELSTTTLEEGSIEITFKSGHSVPLTLTPGEQIVYDRMTHKITFRKVNPVLSSAWTQGFLVFDRTPFDELIRTLERKYDVSFSYDAHKYNGRYYNIVFRPDETLEESLDLLRHLIDGFEYTIIGKTVVIK